MRSARHRGGAPVQAVAGIRAREPGHAWGVLVVNSAMALWLHRRVVTRLRIEPSFLGLRIRR